MSSKTKAVVAAVVAPVAEEAVNAVAGPHVKKTKTGEVSIGKNLQNQFLGIGKQLALTYGTRGLKTLAKSVHDNVTVAESMTHEDGTPYGGKEKFGLAANLIKKDMTAFGIEVGQQTLNALINLAVVNLFGKIGQ